jgi:ribosomal protein S12 methylthiotransferase accessory factor
MDVRLAGDGPAAAAVEAALGDARRELGRRIEPTRVEPGAVGEADLAVVSGATGDGTLRAANASARSTTPWIGVELGGIGDHPVAGVEAAVAGFSPDGACFDCLRSRVAAAEPETGSGDGSSPRPGVARFAGAIAGRELLGLLAGDATRVFSATPDETPLVGVVEVPSAERSVLPVPGCCGERERDLSLSHVDRDLEATLERAELALDERIGAISSVGEVESFPAPYYLTSLSDTTEFSDGAAPDNAAGVDVDWNLAFVKALGEALERYSAAVYRTDSFRSAPPGALDGAIGPDRFVIPDDAPPVGDDPIPWVPGVDLTDESEVFLPAEAVHFPPPDGRYLPSITTGLGLGNSTVEAVLSGLYEVVERDAAMIAWYSTFEPLGLGVENERYGELVRRARSEDLSATAIMLTVDVDVPVVGAAVHRDDEWPRFAAASAADFDPGAAAADALAEAVQNWMELRSIGPEEAREESSAIGRYAETPDEALSFFDAERTVPAESVSDPDAERETGGRAGLDRLIDRVTAAGLTPYAADVTPRDVAIAGFAAVRVAVPGSQPLFGDVERPAFGERARTVPGEMGFEPELDGAPHPFP